MIKGPHLAMPMAAAALLMSANAFPMAAPGFAPSNPFLNRTVALDQVDSTYLSLEEMMFRREILNAVDDTFMEQEFIDTLELTDRTAPSVADKFYHYEQGSLYRACRVGSVVSATAGSATFTLAASSYTDTGSNKGMINRSPLKITDEIMLPGRIWGYIISKTGVGLSTQYTAIRRNNSSENIGAAIQELFDTQGQFATPSNAHGPGSGQPDEGMDSLATRYEGRMQIFKQMRRIDGDADAAYAEVTVPGAGNYYYNKLAIEAAKKQKLDRGFAHMFSPGGSFTNSGGFQVQLSMGMEGYLMNLGQNYYYQRSIGFTELNMLAISQRIKALSGCREYLWTMGSSLRADIETFLAKRTQNGGLSYNSFGIGSNAERAVDLGYGSFKIYDVVFHLHTTRAFEHPEVTGLVGMNYDCCGFLIPGDKVKINREIDGERKNGPISSITLRYKVSSKKVSRRWIEWEDDRRTNGGFDTFQWNVQSQEGVQLAGANRFIRVQGY